MAEDFSVHMFSRMNQDFSFDKRDPNHYWEAMNMELFNNGDSLSMVSSSGNTLKINLLSVSEDLSNADSYSLFYDGVNYNFFRDTDIVDSNVRVHSQQTIIGMSTMRDDLYIFTVTEFGLNIIFRYNESGTVIVFAGYMGMTADNQLEIISNYENDKVQKLYWVDGANWFRLLNVSPSNADVLETLDPQFVDVTIPINMKSPTVISQTSGGNIPAGRRQYAYSLYNRSGQQSVVSPLSAIHSISESNTKGGELDELMNVALNVQLTDLDTNFDSIIVYAIHYNTYNTAPEITVILDEGLSGSDFQFKDDGNLYVSDFSTDAFLALSNSNYKGGTINVKKNVLFMADYKTDSFAIDFEARAFSYNDATGEAHLVDSEGLNPITIVGTNYSEILTMPEYDSVNVDDSVYKYQYGNTQTGGTGPYVSYRHESVQITDNIKSESFLKKGDKYRIGIVFRDKYGRVSPVQWVADTRIPYTYSGFGTTIRVTINTAGINIAKSAGAVGYSIVMVNRSADDRDILAQGIVQPTFRMTDLDGTYINGDASWRPYYITKDICSGVTGGNIERANDFDNGVSKPIDIDLLSNRQIHKSDQYATFYSPDVKHTNGLDIEASSVNIVGFSTVLASNCTSLYEAWDGSGYGYGRDHDYLKYYNAVPSNAANNIFANSNTNEEIPFCLMGPSDHSGSGTFSYEAYFTKPYGGVGLLGTIENVPLKEPSKLVKTSDQILIDGSEAFKNDLNVYKLTGDGGWSNSENSSNSTALDCVSLVFNDEDWHTTNPGVAPKYDKFVDLTGQPSDIRAIPIIDLKAGLSNQYGGNSFEVRRRNTYIEISDYIEFGDTDTSITANTGDTFMREATLVKSSGDNKIDNWSWHVYEYIRIQLETYIDPSNVSDNSNGIMSDTNRLVSHNTLRITTQEQYNVYNQAYNRLPDVTTAIPKPYNFQEITNFDTNIIATGFKFNNEVIDSWTNFLPNETMQLDSRFGKITKLQELQGELYAFQPQAIAALSILPKVSVQANDGINLEMGSGTVLDDYTYLTTRSGSLNKWSIYSLDNDIFYYDYHNKSISSIKQGSLSVKMNMYNFINDKHILNADLIIEDKPLLNKAVITTYDSNKKNLYFTMLGEKNVTISYNTLAEGFISLHSFYPKLGIEYMGNHITSHTNNKLYESIYKLDNTIGRRLYDNVFESYITILSSKDPLESKTFGNVEFETKGDYTFDKVEAWNDYQTTGSIVLGRPNFKKLYRKFRIALPREQGTRNTLQDTKLWVKLSNSGKQEISNIVLNNVEIKYVK